MDVELAPLRPLNDFLLESARFQVPDAKDANRWANRIINNLLYYQTNYFLTAIVMFLLVGFFNPVQMLFGLVTIAAAFAGAAYISNHKPGLRRFKRNQPMLFFFLVLVVGYIVIHMLGSVMTFICGIAFPTLAILIHASLRLRNLKSKITNKMEYVGIKRTPMGLFLEAIGLEQEAGS